MRMCDMGDVCDMGATFVLARSVVYRMYFTYSHVLSACQCVLSSTVMRIYSACVTVCSHVTGISRGKTVYRAQGSLSECSLS